MPALAQMAGAKMSNSAAQLFLSKIQSKQVLTKRQKGAEKWRTITISDIIKLKRDVTNLEFVKAITALQSLLNEQGTLRSLDLLVDD